MKSRVTVPPAPGLRDYDRAARLLQETLEEESMANEKLTQIAESHVNIEAQ